MTDSFRGSKRHKTDDEGRIDNTIEDGMVEKLTCHPIPVIARIPIVQGKLWS